jgi:hypothetical protein
MAVSCRTARSPGDLRPAGSCHQGRSLCITGSATFTTARYCKKDLTVIYKDFGNGLSLTGGLLLP